MDRNKIYEINRTSREAVEEAHRQVREIKPHELEILGATDVDGLLTHIEAVAVEYRARMQRGEKIDEDYGGVNRTLKFVKYLREQLGLPQ